MAQVAIHCDLAPALESIAELDRFKRADIERLPRHLRVEAERFAAGSGEAFEVVPPLDPRAAFSIAPTPRLMAFLANLRAGGFIPPIAS